MDRYPGSRNRCPVRRANALMSEADPKDRDRGPESLDRGHRQPSLGGRTRPGRHDDMRRRQGRNRLQCEAIAAVDDGLLPELSHVAGEVVDEGVVVVEQEDHALSASEMPRALCNVSSYSRAGSDSASTPPPAWKYTFPPFTTQVRIATLVSPVPLGPQ